MVALAQTVLNGIYSIVRFSHLSENVCLSMVGRILCSSSCTSEVMTQVSILSPIGCLVLNQELLHMLVSGRSPSAMSRVLFLLSTSELLCPPSMRSALIIATTSTPLLQSLQCL